MFRISGACVCLLVFVSLIASCGTSHPNHLKSEPGNGIDSQIPVSALQALPIDGVQPWEVVDLRGYVLPAAQHLTSALPPSAQFTPGVERFLEGGTVTDLGEATSINSGANGQRNLSYAIYRLTMGGTQPGTLALDVNLHQQTTGQPSTYWVAISDFAAERWKWKGQFADGQAVLDLPSGDYLSALGNFFVVIAAYDGAKIDVVGLTASDLDNLDTAAPPIPATPSAVPVIGALELSWAGVVASDLAGYRILYSYQPFSAPTDVGVRNWPLLENTERMVLPLLPRTAFLAIQAVDLNGNASGMSPLTSALPLPGSILTPQVNVNTPSALLNGAATLTFSGASLFDIDANGDGTFEATDQPAGTFPVDTTTTGLIRPAVRAHDPGGTAVALGSVSLIVTGNQRPVAVARVDVQSGTVPLPVNFIGSDSVDPDGNIAEWAWDRTGDGIYEVLSTTNSDANGSYGAPGLYNAKLRVTDNQNSWDVDTVSVLASNAPIGDDGQDPVGSILPSRHRGASPFGVFFDAGQSFDPNGSIASYAFDFEGDGSFDAMGSSSRVFHQYLMPGLYEPIVQVTDTSGLVATSKAYVGFPSEWSCFGMDPAHTHRSPYVGPSDTALNRDKTYTEAIMGSPVIGIDGSVYFTCLDDRLYSIDKEGQDRWSFDLGVDSSCTPAIGLDGTIYVGTLNSSLWAFDGDGNLAWPTPFNTGNGAEIISGPTVGWDGTIYFGCNDDFFYALYPNGDLRWVFDAGDHVECSPALGYDGTIYFGNMDSANGLLFALNPDGSLKWKWPDPANHPEDPSSVGAFKSSPSISPDGQTLYIGNDDGRLYAIRLEPTPSSASEPRMRASIDFGDKVQSSPAIGWNGRIYVGCDTDRLYAIDDNGTLSQAWEFDTGARISGSPAVDGNGIIYIGNHGPQNRLYAIQDLGGNNRQEIWQDDGLDEIQSGPVIARNDSTGNAIIYYGTVGGRLRAIWN
jgi:outer membrane protein assembly factor BamB